MFPSNLLDFEREAAFRDDLGEIGNGRCDNARWDARQRALKQHWADSAPDGSPISVIFKRDHKVQRRVQCGMSFARFSDLFSQTYDPLRTYQLEQALDGLGIPAV